MGHETNRTDSSENSDHLLNDVFAEIAEEIRNGAKIDLELGFDYIFEKVSHLHLIAKDLPLKLYVLLCGDALTRDSQALGQDFDDLKVGRGLQNYRVFEILQKLNVPFVTLHINKVILIVQYGEVL